MAATFNGATFGGEGNAIGVTPPQRTNRLWLWRAMALVLAFYVVGQDAMRVLRFSQWDANAGTFAASFVPSPNFAPGYVEITQLAPDGPMAAAGVAVGDHIKFDADIRNDVLPIAGDVRRFTIDRAGSKTRSQVTAVTPRDNFIDRSLYTKSLLIAAANLIAALFSTYIIWRGRNSASTLLLGVSLVAYFLTNSSPWTLEHDPQIRSMLNQFGRLIQTMSPVAFVAFSLQFYREFVGSVRRAVWWIVAIYAALMLVLLAISEYLETTITILPVIGDGLTIYTIFRVAGSVAALACVAIGWQRSRSDTQQRYAILFAALFIMVVSRLLYLSHFYLLLGIDRRYTIMETSLAVLGTGLAAPLFAYAILKQKVLDLGFAINRTLIYGIISFGLLLIFGLIEWGSERLLPHERLEASAVLNAGVALTIFVVFHRIRDFVERIVERLLFRSWHESEARLRRFVREAAFASTSQSLASATVDALARFAGGAQCAIYLRKDDGYVRAKGKLAGAKTRIDGDDRLAAALRANHSPVEPAEARSGIPAAVALPMTHRAQLDGIVLLGSKPSGDSYRPDEIELLGWAAQQIGLDLQALKVIDLEKGMSVLERRVGELQSQLARTAAKDG